MKEPLGVRPSLPLRPWGMKRVSLDKTDDLDFFSTRLTSASNPWKNKRPRCQTKNRPLQNPGQPKKGEVSFHQNLT